jgi:glycosyltransferase involved in cell wall biosynthesis
VRIAMDGSFLRLPPSGTAAYVRGLQAGFAELQADIDLFLLDPDWRDFDCQMHGPLNWLTCTTKPIWKHDRLERARWEWFGVAREAKRRRVDLLHIPHFSAPIRPSMPLVVTIHDVIPLVLTEYRASRAMRAHLAIVRRTVKRARLILTPSQSAAADITRVLGISPDKIRITPEAADERYVPALDRASVKQAITHLGIQGSYIFNVGGLDVRKNLFALIEAFALAKSDLPESMKLVIAGAAHTSNSNVYPPLEPVITRFGLNERVQLLGRVSEEDKLLLYQASDLYVTPSTYEGFGLTALEAMACGVPTIAANRTSLPEVVGDGGLLVEPDAQAISRAIVEVMSSAETIAALSARGLERARRFTWRRTAELTLNAYREALAGSRKGET